MVMIIRSVLTLLVLLLGMTFVFKVQSATPLNVEPTVIYIVRHAEKMDGNNNDPSLSQSGHERARELARMIGETTIGNSRISIIYISTARRTRETAQPLATKLNIPLQTFFTEIASDLKSRKHPNTGKTLLIVGHSNTVPDIIHQLTGKTVPLIEEKEYDNLYLVVLPKEGPSRLLRLKYGKAT
jgi:2,3-bisphosphoglycerate-dependent phosphoglycerate mutase